MSGISTHVLDTSIGGPATGVEVRLERARDQAWETIATAVTDTDGRVRALLPPNMPLTAGTYRLTFASGAYFARSSRPAFHPHVVVVFEVAVPDAHHHVPLLVSPFGYTTYRGT